MTVPLPQSTSDTRTLTRYALNILRAIYRPGFGYHKAGVMLLDLSPQDNRQFSLFGTRGGVEGARSEKLMGALDRINQRYGRRTLHFGAEGVGQSWQMRSGNLSPGYTTSWDGVPVVRAG